MLPERVFSLVKQINADGDVVLVTEAYTKRIAKGEILGGSVGVSACGMSVERYRELGRPYKLLR